MTENKGISIWFFIGTLLLSYGVIITTANVYELFYPGFGSDTVLKNLHFGVWWGIILIIIGAIYFVSFRPWKKSHANT